MFQTIYDSGWHHPFVAFMGVVALAVLVWRRAKPGFLRLFFALFGLEIAIDALCTGAWSPVPAAIVSSVSIAFVILGDWRLSLLVERFTGRPYLARSIAIAFVVPVLQAAAIKLSPETFTEPRRIYLVYELLFVLFGSILRFAVWPRRLASASPAIRTWALSCVSWFLVQYSLWATSDVIILAGGDWGLLLRLVPNTMYYAGFLLFAALTAPEEAWS